MILAAHVIAGTNVQVVELIEQKRLELCRPIVVGISGYAGSGKSTLARDVVGALPGAVRMRGDDFLDPTRSHHRSDDWSGVERERLVTEVLSPFRDQHPGVFRRFDWTRRELGAPEPLPTGNVLVADLIGLFHPDALPALDMAIWVDVSLDNAQARGMRREEALGRAFTRLWLDVWVPNEIDFERIFSPRDQADVLYVA